MKQKGKLRKSIPNHRYWKQNGSINKNGRNSYKNLLSLINIKVKKRIKVNLSGDEMYKLIIK